MRPPMRFFPFLRKTQNPVPQSASCPKSSTPSAPRARQFWTNF